MDVALYQTNILLLLYMVTCQTDHPQDLQADICCNRSPDSSRRSRTGRSDQDSCCCCQLRYSHMLAAVYIPLRCVLHRCCIATLCGTTPASNNETVKTIEFFLIFVRLKNIDSMTDYMNDIYYLS